MKNWKIYLISVLGLVFILSLPLHTLGEQKELVVYTYDSFVSWGPAKFIEKEFEKETGAEVRFVAPGDSRKMINRLKRELEKGKTTADIFLGIESNDVPLVKGEGIFMDLNLSALPNLRKVPQKIRLELEDKLVPYEYGYITLVYNKDMISEEDLPKTFEDLTKDKYRNSLIVEDPRVSSPGYSFLLWTIDHFGEDWIQYWKDLQSSILTIPGGWSEAYTGLFKKGEAPMVVSFSTDTAYSKITGGDFNQGILLLNNEGYLNIYGMGIVRGTDQPTLAHEFLDFVLSKKVQEKIPTSEWMFPANKEASLPIKFYQYAVRPPKAVSMPLEKIEENGSEWIEEWARAIR